MSLQAATKNLLADVETPVSAYLKLCRGQSCSFLFESGETHENVGRYSIVTWEPLCRLRLWHDRLELDQGGQASRHAPAEFFALARRVLGELDCQGLPDLPFVGSLLGYVGYDALRLIEPLGPAPAQELPIADLCFPASFLVFDHLQRTMTLVGIDRDQAAAQARLADIEDRLRHPLRISGRLAQLSISDPPRERFQEAVRRAKEYILAGDIFQVVLSDQFRGQSDLDPLTVYRWLRVKSPSPYMFFLHLDDLRLVGASPETLVKTEAGRVQIRPLAGTRGRSADPRRDQELERELMASEKERAEHIMLVDLARNDVGRVAEYGSVAVEPYMAVERYSHVMHIVSEVTGRLRPGLDAWDAFRAGFPAGTVSGAPKVRAAQIIDELEALPRGPYAGAVGCFGPGPRMDTCIAIRMIQFQGDQVTLQAGAGIVADSLPEMEYAEIQHKAAQGIAALRAAAEASL
ncbi:MAG: anthranilate synthase component I family protein [Desulfarculus sp.]|nr:MAG: anthranilate synthase component I family protein [Desulfarculus sp.]